MKNLLQPLKTCIALVAAALLFLGCSDDNESKKDTTTLRYFIRMDATDIVVVKLMYRNAAGDMVEAPETEVQAVDSGLEWSKTVNAELPFNARMELRVFNQSGGATSGMMLLYKGDEVLGYEDLSIPDGMTFDAEFDQLAE